MKEWYEPSLRADFDDPYYYDDPRENDYVHVDDLPDLDHARDHMTKVLEALYSGASLESLESSLEEVLSILEMKMPTGPLTVRKENV